MTNNRLADAAAAPGGYDDDDCGRHDNRHADSCAFSSCCYDAMCAAAAAAGAGVRALLIITTRVRARMCSCVFARGCLCDVTMHKHGTGALIFSGDHEIARALASVKQQQWRRRRRWLQSDHSVAPPRRSCWFSFRVFPLAWWFAASLPPVICYYFHVQVHVSGPTKPLSWPPASLATSLATDRLHLS